MIAMVVLCPKMKAPTTMVMTPQTVKITLQWTKKSGHQGHQEKDQYRWLSAAIKTKNMNILHKTVITAYFPLSKNTPVIRHQTKCTLNAQGDLQFFSWRTTHLVFLQNLWCFSVLEDDVIQTLVIQLFVDLYDCCYRICSHCHVCVTRSRF